MIENHIKNEPTTLGFKGKHIVKTNTTRKKYLNTFSFIRWPRSRLHGHFYSVPTLQFTGVWATDGQTKTSMMVPPVSEDSAFHFKGPPPSPYQLFTEGQGALAEKVSPKLVSCSGRYLPAYVVVEAVTWCFLGSVFRACDVVPTFRIIHYVWKVWKWNQNEAVGSSGAGSAHLTRQIFNLCLGGGGRMSV